MTQAFGIDRNMFREFSFILLKFDAGSHMNGYYFEMLEILYVTREEVLCDEQGGASMMCGMGWESGYVPWNHENLNTHEICFMGRR